MSDPGIDLSAIRLPAPNPPTQPDEQTQQEQQDLDRTHRRALIRGTEQDIDERKKYANRVFWLICFWLAAVFLLLIAEGLGSILRFNLGERVTLAVIGSTTINVLGIFYIVAHYLFPNR